MPISAMYISIGASFTLPRTSNGIAYAICLQVAVFLVSTRHSSTLSFDLCTTPCALLSTRVLFACSADWRRSRIRLEKFLRRGLEPSKANSSSMRAHALKLFSPRFRPPSRARPVESRYLQFTPLRSLRYCESRFAQPSAFPRPRRSSPSLGRPRPGRSEERRVGKEG